MRLLTNLWLQQFLTQGSRYLSLHLQTCLFLQILKWTFTLWPLFFHSSEKNNWFSFFIDSSCYKDKNNDFQALYVPELKPEIFICFLLSSHFATLLPLFTEIANKPLKLHSLSHCLFLSELKLRKPVRHFTRETVLSYPRLLLQLRE